MVIKSEVARTVWKLEVSADAIAATGDTLVVLESMKMEISVDAPCAGTVKELCVVEKEVVAEGRILVVPA